jgi:hypothetical protein
MTRSIHHSKINFVCFTFYLLELIDWLDNKGGDVAIFDATNTTKDRR